MTDITERLRSVEFADVAQKYLMIEAADEIEQLRLQIGGLIAQDEVKSGIIRELDAELMRLRAKSMN